MIDQAMQLDALIGTAQVAVLTGIFFRLGSIKEQMAALALRVTALEARYDSLQPCQKHRREGVHGYQG